MAPSILHAPAVARRLRRTSTVSRGETLPARPPGPRGSGESLARARPARASGAGLAPSRRRGSRTPAATGARLLREEQIAVEEPAGVDDGSRPPPDRGPGLHSAKQRRRPPGLAPRRTARAPRRAPTRPRASGRGPAEAHDLAAREHGGGQRAAAAARRGSSPSRRRLLQRLEEGVRRVAVIRSASSTMKTLRAATRRA